MLSMPFPWFTMKSSPEKSEALKRECAIKKLTKKEKEALVKTFAAGSLPLSACKAKNP